MRYTYLEFGKMYRSLKKCCKNVRWKTSVTQYEVNGLKNTAKVTAEINSGKYKLLPYQEFQIHEPKERHITATRIRDRQVQRSICDTVVYDSITRSFVADNSACQKGRGTQYAIDRLKEHIRRYYRKNGAEGYYLKCDIHHFFESLDHNIIKAQLRKRITNEHYLNMLYDIIDSFPGEKGIGLGSQVSQLLALMYLDEMDHIIKEKLHIKYYIRYMDDFILVDQSREKLAGALAELRRYLDTLGLALNKKTTLQKLSQGVIFLGWKFILTDTGKVILKPDKRKLTAKRRKLRGIKRQQAAGNLSEKDVMQIKQGMIAHLEHGNARRVIEQIVRT